MIAAKSNFDNHISQCEEAITVYEFLENHGYKADFGLRFVWVASLSALDHYVTEFVVEKATASFSNGDRLTEKLLSEGVPLTALLSMREVSTVQTVVEFRTIIKNALRFKTFQKADAVADGLAYVWSEKRKWKKIADYLGVKEQSAKGKLSSICARRNLIVHNADYIEATGELTPCLPSDAKEVVAYTSQIVMAIESLVP